MIPIAKPILGEEEQRAVIEVLRSGMIACGPKVQEFEKQFALFVGTKYAVATTSGTTALHLALLSIGIKKGDEIIIPSFSFISTANSVLFCNAIPIFCDVNPQTFNLDTKKIENLITKKTKAIMPVHLYGQPSDMKPILEIAEKYGINVICDAAQAHGAKYNNKMVGSFGDAECFSFYSTKNMTTGEGGIITTNDDTLVKKLYSLRNHGRTKERWGYDHSYLGYNYRMTDIAANIGIEQLKKLPEFNKKRKDNARYLNQKLESVKWINIPQLLENIDHVYHQYTIRSNKREEIIQCLKKKDVGYGIYYPKPLHFYPHLKKYAHKDLKISENLANEVISLPIHPSLNNHELEIIVSCFNS